MGRKGKSKRGRQQKKPEAAREATGGGVEEMTSEQGATPAASTTQGTGSGWMIAIGLVLLTMVVLVGIGLAQSPQVTIGATEATLREEVRFESVSERIWLIFPLFMLLAALSWAQDAMKEGTYLKAVGCWALGMAMAALVLWQGRNALTASELRVHLPSQSLTCSGYLLGQKMWSESMLFTQTQAVTFPPLSGRHGVLVKGTGGEFCSLDWKLLTRAQAEQVASMLAPLGSKVTKP